MKVKTDGRGKLECCVIYLGFGVEELLLTTHFIQAIYRVQQDNYPYVLTYVNCLFLRKYSNYVTHTHLPQEVFP